MLNDRRVLEVQIRLLARHLSGELAEYPPLRRADVRTRYFVTYDITDDPRRTAVYKLLRGFGDHVQ